MNDDMEMMARLVVVFLPLRTAATSFLATALRRLLVWRWFWVSIACVSATIGAAALDAVLSIFVVKRDLE